MEPRPPKPGHTEQQPDSGPPQQASSPAAQMQPSSPDVLQGSSQQALLVGSPAAAAAVTPNSAHNADRSRLLALPDPILAIIARLTTKDTRLVCQRLCDAYSSPPASMTWPRPRTAQDLTDSIDDDGVKQQQLADLLQTYRHASQLTSLTIYSDRLLQPTLFQAIATHLPSLCTLTCPWLECLHPADQPLPSISSLTSLQLEAERLTFQQFLHYQPEGQQQFQQRMQAFVQLPQLLPQLQALSFDFGHLLFPDATFAAAMQQLSSRLTRLSLGSAAHAADNTGSELHSPLHVLPGITAVSGSLQHLIIEEPRRYGAGMRDVLPGLTQLTCLHITCAFSIDENMGCLPPCHLLPKLRRLELDYQVLPDQVAVVVAWLAAGQASTTLQELCLPRAHDIGDTLNLVPLLEAAPHYGHITSLDVWADAPRNFTCEVGGFWPATISRLEGLQQLVVHMPARVVGSISSWSALAQLTSLSLALEFDRRWLCGLPHAAHESAVGAGLSRLPLHSVKLAFELPDCYGDVVNELEGPEWVDDVRLARLWVLKALAVLPQLEVLDVSGAWLLFMVKERSFEFEGGDEEWYSDDEYWDEDGLEAWHKVASRAGGQGVGRQLHNGGQQADVRRGGDEGGDSEVKEEDEGDYLPWGDVYGVEELGVLADGAASQSLRRLVLPKAFPKEGVQFVRGALPRVALEFGGKESIRMRW